MIPARTHQELSRPRRSVRAEAERKYAEWKAKNTRGRGGLRNLDEEKNR